MSRFRTLRRTAVLALLPAGLLGLALLGSCGPDRPELDSQRYELSAAVEQWRALVEKYFKNQHVTWALNIIACESGGNPKAYNASSGASGLFQHLAIYWAERAKKAGFPGASVFDPEANIAASAYLLYAAGGGPKHWSCKHSPFEEPGYQPKFWDDNGNPIGTQPPPTGSTCPELPASGGIIDEKSPCFEKAGTETYWHVVTGQGHDGSLLWTDATSGATPDNTAKWKISLAAAGRYEVKYYGVPEYAVFSATRYTVRHKGQETPLTINQSGGSAGWRTLGTFDFAKGADQYVAIFDNASATVPKNQHIVVDAIRLDPAGTTTPPPTGDARPTGPSPDGGVSVPPPPGSPPTQPPQTEPTDPDGNPVMGGCSVAEGPGSHSLAIVLLALWWLSGRRRGSRRPRTR
ncbi:MAG: transglycosylase SLT domain-containing protein [Deltaproteobacteria bacterium]|nr:transglycosylase SLT domain-containing protein [Deltaproteobacteria bacterium]